MLSDIRLIHPPAASSNPTPHPVAVITVDNRKYVFNAPEGIVRTLTQRRLSVGGKGELDVFLTDACEAARGLPGLLMSLADSGKDKVRAYGPPPLAHAISTMRFYAKRNECQLQVKECFDPTVSAPGDYRITQPLLAEKGGLTVRGLLSWEQGWVIPERPAPSTADSKRKRRASSDLVPRLSARPSPNDEADTADDSTAMATSLRSSTLSAASSSKLTQRRVFAIAHDMFKGGKGADSALDDPSAIPKGRPLSAAWDTARLPQPVISPFQSGQSAVPPTQPLALSYIATLPTVPGSMNMAAAKLLGIRPGPQLSQLQRGDSVTIRRPVRWNQMSDAEKTQWSETRFAKVRPTKVAKPGPVAVEEEPMEEFVVQSSDVVAPSRPGPVVLLVHLPTEGHLPSFLSPHNASVLDTATEERDVTAIIHTSPLDVIRTQRYQNWMKAVSSPDTLHMFTARELAKDGIIYGSSALSLMQLSALDSKRFSLPPYTTQAPTPASFLATSSSVKITAFEMDQTLRLQPNVSTFAPSTLENGRSPAVSFDFDDNVKTDSIAATKKRLMSYGARKGHNETRPERRNNRDGGGPGGRPGDDVAADAPPPTLTNRSQLKTLRQAAYLEFEDAAASIKAEIASIEANEKSDERLTRKEWEGIEITTLGTGSSQPSKARGSSATLIQIPSHFFSDPHSLVPSPDGGPTYGYVLLDAGDGSLGQLHQRYGKDSPRLRNVLQNLRLLFVSHIHADHCSGVGSILRARYETEGTKTPLFLVSNSFMRKALLEWNDIQPLNLLDLDEYARLDPRHVSDSVVLLEAEHLDYRFGVGAPQTALSRGEEKRDSPYLQELARRRMPRFIGWLKGIRREVMAKPAFATEMSADDEHEVAVKQTQVNEAIWSTVRLRDPHVGAKRKTMPAFAEHALATGIAGPEGLSEEEDEEMRAFFLPNAWQTYERHEKEDRSMTRSALRLLHREFGSHWNVSTCAVDHRMKHCFGLVVRIGETNDGEIRGRSKEGLLNLDASSTKEGEESGKFRPTFSFAYSGDTRPTSNLSKAAEDVNLLIHEATMSDDEAELANIKGHSTIHGAISIAEEAQCDVVILTHFSQRYPKMPVLNLMQQKSSLSKEGGEDGEQNKKKKKRKPIVTIGMDLLQMEMNEMWKMERYLPAMEILFRHENKVVEDEGGEEDEDDAGGGLGGKADYQGARTSVAGPAA